MKFKTIAFICMILLIMVMPGCINSGAKQLTMKDLRTGTKALTMNFIPSADMKVMQGDQFVIAMELKNEGAYNIKALDFLFAVENDYVKILSKKFNNKPVGDYSIGELKGKSPEIPGGDLGIYEVELEAKKITLSKLQDTMVTGIACYDYATDAEESVCIQPKGLNIGLEPGCIQKDVIFPGYGQGAPLTVTKIEVKSSKMSSNQIRNVFKIYIENKGKGNIVRRGGARFVCSSKPFPAEDKKFLNYFHAFVRLGGQSIKCRAIQDKDVIDDNSYVIRLKDKKAEFVCEAIIQAGHNYETPLKVGLRYDYTETVIKKVTIEKI